MSHLSLPVRPSETASVRSSTSGSSPTSMWLACVLGFALALTVPWHRAAHAQQPTLGVEPVVPLSAEVLYQGWRASKVLGQEVKAKDGGKLGTVRNILINQVGHIEALIVEGESLSGRKEFVFRIPWRQLNAASLPDSISTDLTRADRPEHGIFSREKKGSPTPDAFALTQVIGEFARLQAGQGFGYVSDVVFSREGAMIAVLVTRDWVAGAGGTYAFGFPGTIGQWGPEIELLRAALRHVGTGFGRRNAGRL